MSKYVQINATVTTQVSIIANCSDQSPEDALNKVLKASQNSTEKLFREDFHEEASIDETGLIEDFYTGNSPILSVNGTLMSGIVTNTVDVDKDQSLELCIDYIRNNRLDLDALKQILSDNLDLNTIKSLSNDFTCDD